MRHHASVGVPALHHVPLFQLLDDQQVHKISLLLKERHYRKGDTVFHQGDPGGCLFLVTSGRVRIFLNSADGREATVRFYGPNSAFGEFSVLDGQPRSASAAAVDDVTTLVLYRDDFMPLLRQHFELVEQLFAMLTERLRYTTSYSEQLAFLSVPGRVASVLLELAGIEADPLTPARLELTQEDLAKFANTTREWVNRSLRELAEAGLIHVERKAVVVLDRAGLARRVH
jgi:CRP/FNR family transcriptional regulator, cyclic AMP receptor protein